MLSQKYKIFAFQIVIAIFSLCYDTVIGVTGVQLKLLQNTED